MSTNRVAAPPKWTQTVALSSGASTLFRHVTERKGQDRRRHRRIPRSLGISVQPLDEQMSESSSPFFAITRDVSAYGLGYLSPVRATFEMAIISLKDRTDQSVVCRICDCSLVHTSDVEEVFLTNVEFLYERYM